MEEDILFSGITVYWGGTRETDIRSLVNNYWMHKKKECLNWEKVYIQKGI